MNRIEEAECIRAIFLRHKHNNEEQLKLVEEIREIAIHYLKPITPQVSNQLSNEIKTAIVKKGFSLKWDLTSLGVLGAYSFCEHALRQGKLSSPRLQSAARLLECCTMALEQDLVTNEYQNNILAAYAGLDSGAIVYGKRFSKTQSKKASKPREMVITDDGKTLNDLIYRYKSPQYSGQSARDRWSQFIGDLDRYNLDPQESQDGSSVAFTTDVVDSKEKSISFKTFQNKLSKK